MAAVIACSNESKAFVASWAPKLMMAAVRVGCFLDTVLGA